MTLSHRGYIKRTPSSEYRLQARGGKGVRGMETRGGGDEEESDFVEHLFTAQAHDYLMFFTNTGRVYVERVYGLPEGSRASKGRSIKNVLDLQPEESIAAVLRLEYRTDDESGDDITFAEDAGNVFFATRSGKVKKTSLYDFKNYRKAGTIAIKLDAAISVGPVVEKSARTIPPKPPVCSSICLEKLSNTSGHGLSCPG